MATLLKLGFQCFPGDAFAPVLIERKEAAVKLRPLRRCQGKLLVFEAVPKLRDQSS